MCYKIKQSIDTKDMYNTFNMGIGFMMVVAPEDVQKVLNVCEQLDEAVYEIGTVEAGDNEVQLWFLNESGW